MSHFATDKSKRQKPKKPVKVQPEPAPEGRAPPHHTGEAADPRSCKEYRDHTTHGFDPHGQRSGS